MVQSPKQLALVQHLRRARLFQGIEGGLLDHLSAHARLCSFKRGTVVLGQDDLSGHLRILVSGSIDKLILGANGREVVLRTLTAGQMFGHECLTGSGPTGAAYCSAGDVTVIELARRDAEPLLEDPRFARALRFDLARELREMERFIRRMLVCNLENRIAHYLHDSQAEAGPTAREILLQDSQPRIAAKVNASRTRVNITLQNWVKSGDITVSRNRITIQNEQFWKKYLVE